MAERKAVNKYYPPDWDPRKGSVNKRVGQHPLRDRARKLSQGILVIRFELPYNIWCGGCGSHVGMGVRYNAEKSKVGNYYSTPIYKFRMKCHLCDNYFEIQTDPQNHDYVILSGARRKEQRWDPHANEQIVPEDKATQKKLATDAMYKLEHGSDDKQKGKDKVQSLAQIEESRISMIDDYLLNRMARDKFRAEKHELNEAAEADRVLLEKSSLDISLVDETEEDRKMAGLLKYSVTTSFEDKQKEKRKHIEHRPLFDTTTASRAPSCSPMSASSVLCHQRHIATELSRRGQIKQKLGWAVKASLKDPFFKTTKNKNGQTSSSNTTSPRALLGIKLKSLKGQHYSDSLTKASTSQKGLTWVDVKKALPASDTSETVAREVVSGSGVEGSACDVALGLQSMMKLHDQNGDVKVEKRKEDATEEKCDSSSVEKQTSRLNEPVEIVPSVPVDRCMNEKLKNCDIRTVGHEHEFLCEEEVYYIETACKHSNKTCDINQINGECNHGNIEHSSPSLLDPKASGLSALMSSYTSDSDSDR